MTSPAGGPRLRVLGTAYPLLPLGATVAIGLAGALLAVGLGAPLPWLSGGVVAVGLAAILGLRPAGAPLAFPVGLRQLFVPVIGVTIGAAFTPGLLGEAPAWTASLLALLLYVPVAQVGGYLWCRRVGGLDPATAWFGAMPGGFVEAITLGEENGANMPVLAAMQFLRLILCILLVPVAFSVWQGEVVGSAAGVELPGARVPLAPLDIVLLVACGVGGWLFGRLTRLPAGIITGPLVLSGTLHLLGLVQGQPAPWLIALTQLVIGISLGVRFAGIARAELARAARLAATLVAFMLALAFLLGLALGPLVGEPVEAVILAFAPGGLVEMSLVALSLGISAVYVTAHHVLRIVLAVAIGRAGWGVARRRQ